MDSVEGDILAADATPRLGILQWFWYEQHELVECAIEDLLELGVRDLRTGISWADAWRERGWDWFDWLVPRLARHFELLPCLTFTPPSEALLEHSASPPREPRRYAAFVEQVLARYGEHFEWVQLWNEPNNDANWSSEVDPDLVHFSAMIRPAARVVQRHGKRVLLGGVSPIERFFFSTLEEAADESTLQYVDAVGVHGFAGRLEEYWQGWKSGLHSIRTMLDWLGHEDVAIWIDEVGYPATTREEEMEQLAFIRSTLQQPVPRVYVYSLYDMPSQFRTYDSFTVEGGGHNGVRTCGLLGPHDEPRREKMLYRLWRERGVEGLLERMPT